MCKRYQEHQEEQKNILVNRSLKVIEQYLTHPILSHLMMWHNSHIITQRKISAKMRGSDSKKTILYSRLPMCVTDIHRKQQKQLLAPHKHLEQHIQENV